MYVDDLMSINTDPRKILEQVNYYFELKPESIQEPDIYLGAKLCQVTLPSRKRAWATSTSSYIQDSIKNLEEWLSQHSMALPKGRETPFPCSYRPELDVTPELTPEMVNYYQSLMGILRWAVELGRMEITTEVSMLSAHLALPRVGHFETVLKVFAYLKRKHNSRLVFDPTYPEFDDSKFTSSDEWKKFYGNVKEAIPPGAPSPKGKSVII